jgi:hypothetical protein
MQRFLSMSFALLIGLAPLSGCGQKEPETREGNPFLDRQKGPKNRPGLPKAADADQTKDSK